MVYMKSDIKKRRVKRPHSPTLNTHKKTTLRHGYYGYAGARSRGVLFFTGNIYQPKYDLVKSDMSDHAADAYRYGLILMDQPKRLSKWTKLKYWLKEKVNKIDWLWNLRVTLFRIRGKFI